MLKKYHVLMVLCLTVFFLIPTTYAHAYFDPGSGSLIIQVLIAGLLGLVIAVRTFKDSILSMLGIKRPPKDEDHEHDSESDSA